MGEFWIDTIELAAGLTNVDIESFKECVLESIYRNGKSVPSYPLDKVLLACAWIKNIGPVLLANTKFSKKIDSLAREQACSPGNRSEPPRIRGEHFGILEFSRGPGTPEVSWGISFGHGRYRIRIITTFEYKFEGSQYTGMYSPGT